MVMQNRYASTKIKNYDINELEALKKVNCEIHGSRGQGLIPRVDPYGYIFSILMYIYAYAMYTWETRLRACV